MMRQMPLQPVTAHVACLQSPTTEKPVHPQPVLASLARDRWSARYQNRSRDQNARPWHVYSVKQYMCSCHHAKYFYNTCTAGFALPMAKRPPISGSLTHITPARLCLAASSVHPARPSGRSSFTTAVYSMTSAAWSSIICPTRHESVGLKWVSSAPSTLTAGVLTGTPMCMSPSLAGGLMSWVSGKTSTSIKQPCVSVE